MVVAAQPSRVTTKGDKTTRVGRIPEFGTPRQKIRTLGYSINDDVAGQPSCITTKANKTTGLHLTAGMDFNYGLYFTKDNDL